MLGIFSVDVIGVQIELLFSDFHQYEPFGYVLEMANIILGKKAG